jgi:hypothetical protein
LAKDSQLARLGCAGSSSGVGRAWFRRHALSIGHRGRPAGVSDSGTCL